MAEIEMSGSQPRCGGCGEEFRYLPWQFDSRVRVPYQGEGHTCAGEIALFAERHRGCAPLRREVTPSGIVVIDRRR